MRQMRLVKRRAAKSSAKTVHQIRGSMVLCYCAVSLDIPVVAVLGTRLVPVSQGDP